MTKDRTGDDIEPDTPPPHDPRCKGTGWIARDADPAVPCLDCKPHLARLRRRGPEGATP